MLWSPVKLGKGRTDLGLCKPAVVVPPRSLKTRIIYSLAMTDEVDSILRSYIILCCLGFFRGG